MMRIRNKWFDLHIGGKDYGMQWGIGICWGINHKYVEGGDFILQGESYWNHYAYVTFDIHAWDNIRHGLKRLFRAGRY
jgi:hypothetical protein